MRAGIGLIGLMVAILLVLWLARPARLVAPPEPPSAAAPGDVLPRAANVSPDEMRRALNEAVQSRVMPVEAQ